MGISSWVDKFEIRGGDSLLTKIFDDGLSNVSYVCAFITENSQDSKWVREELEYAFTHMLQHGSPKIVVLRFDEATVPSFLQSRRYLSFSRYELGPIIEGIMHSANITPTHTMLDAEPFGTLDFHDAVEEGDLTYLLASRRDPVDVDPFFDPEGIEFHRRHLFLLAVDRQKRTVRSRYISKARPAHTAMRISEKHLLLFINDKSMNQTFAMTGRMFRFDKGSLQPKSVANVFEGHNWGWNPWIDDMERLHHKDFETHGNPYRINDEIVADKTWHDLVNIEKSWRDQRCPYSVVSGPGRETGYLRFLDVNLEGTPS